MKAIHEKIKDFHCSLCDYKTYAKSNLYIHVKRMHEGRQLKESCPHCDKLVVHLEYHIRTYHVNNLNIQSFEWFSEKCWIFQHLSHKLICLLCWDHLHEQYLKFPQNPIVMTQITSTVFLTMTRWMPGTNKTSHWRFWERSWAARETERRVTPWFWKESGWSKMP